MFCSACGSQNPPQLRFCRSCGKPIASAAALSADEDDPLKTRLSMPAERASLTTPPQTPPSSPDPMATVVGMQAIKPPTNTGQSQPNPPDPFATQVGGPPLDIAQLRELAARSASNKTAQPAINNEIDGMATVVGMQPVKLPANSPNQDPLKTVTGPPKSTSSDADPLATVVGMQAVDAATLAALSKPAQSQKAPEPVKPAFVDVATPQSPAPTSPTNPVPIPPGLEKTPPKPIFSNSGQSNQSSNLMVYAIVGVVLVLIVIAVLYFK